MSRWLEIKTCDHCGDYRHSCPVSGNNICVHPDRPTGTDKVTPNNIPPWCPLPTEDPRLARVKAACRQLDKISYGVQHFEDDEGPGIALEIREQVKQIEVALYPGGPFVD